MFPTTIETSNLLFFVDISAQLNLRVWLVSALPTFSLGVVVRAVLVFALVIHMYIYQLLHGFIN